MHPRKCILYSKQHALSILFCCSQCSLLVLHKYSTTQHADYDFNSLSFGVEFGIELVLFFVASFSKDGISLPLSPFKLQKQLGVRRF
jgi:hypothetical protein